MKKVTINESTTFDGCQAIAKIDVKVEFTTTLRHTKATILNVAIEKLKYELEREKKREARNE